MSFPIEAVLFLLLLTTAFVITRLRNLFAAAALFGVFSLLSAAMLVLMDAVDVALTEAAVGAGMSTVLILATLALTTDEERLPERVPIVPLLTVLLTGAALLYATLDMPRYGDPEAPIQEHVVPRYIEGTPREIGIPNIVTAVLASYRGFDTYGETMVIFTAGVGAMLLMGRGRRKKRRGRAS
jgi:multicomponent Na+:H+ antiporter subunit B